MFLSYLYYSFIEIASILSNFLLSLYSSSSSCFSCVFLWTFFAYFRIGPALILIKFSFITLLHKHFLLFLYFLYSESSRCFFHFWARVVFLLSLFPMFFVILATILLVCLLLIFLCSLNISLDLRFSLGVSIIHAFQSCGISFISMD